MTTKAGHAPNRFVDRDGGKIVGTRGAQRTFARLSDRRAN